MLIDAQGYIKITDFGLSKMNIHSNEAKSVCGTPEYLAPEIIQKQGYGKSVDWWTLGSIIYEMLTGSPPFYTNNRPELFDKIKNQAPKFPNFLSFAARDILEKLLDKDPSKRLGSINDSEDIKKHEWFLNFNWDDLINKKYQAPFVPNCNDGLGLNNFDCDFTDLAPFSLDINEKKDYKNFSGFSYTTTHDFQEELRS